MLYASSGGNFVYKDDLGVLGMLEVGSLFSLGSGAGRGTLGGCVGASVGTLVGARVGVGIGAPGIGSGVGTLQCKLSYLE